MAIEHKLTDMDTLGSLALSYLGDATRWKEIADYNRLDYPYIVQDTSELKKFFGHGFITVIRANYQSMAIIRKGWKFQTALNPFTGGIIKTFEVTEDTFIPAGIPVGYVPVRCTVPGTFGNVLPYGIVSVEPRTSEIADVQFVAIYNEKQLQGGQDINVRTTGDFIYIPTSTSEVIPEDVRKILELIGGEDLILDSEGNLIFDPSGDLATVSGIDNIRHAVSHRLMTELGELTLHPDYGADLAEIIGSTNVANREKLIEITIIRALAQEDRIKEPKISSIVAEGTKMYVEIEYRVAISDTADRFTITI